jgi:tRNA-Thr(GGU) m(6)t(6)A37 methyltransferase TsaA
VKFEFTPIATIETVFKEKFGVPRQPSLTPSATGVLRFKNDFRIKTALKGLEQFSHLWLIYVFHETGAKDWRPSVRPPRLGGAKKIGVLASRSPHRPNPIGISVVRIEALDLENPKGPRVTVSGVDMLDGTPVLDVKPYIPYADSHPRAQSGWAREKIQRRQVRFSAVASKKLRSSAQKRLITEILSLDPRPAFQQRKQSDQNGFGILIDGVDVKWKIAKGVFFVTDLE